MRNEDGSGQVLRTRLDKGTIHSEPAGTNGVAVLVNFNPVDRACISYDLRFDANFEWSLGGKLPGLQGAAPGISPSAPGGGNDSDGAWSGRVMWLGPGAYSWAGPSNMAVSYMYHPGQVSQYGDNVRWNVAFQRGRWEHIKVCYAMNTVGKSNGTLAAWVNGSQVLSSTDFVYRTRGDLHIDAIAWSLFRGGNTMDWAAPRTNYVDIDNVIVGTF